MRSAHALGEGVQHGGEALALVVALELERLGVGDVLVDLADRAHRLGDRRLDPLLGRAGRRPCRRPRAPCARTASSTGSSGPGCGISPKFLAIIAAGAVDQVAPARDELGVVALDELGPGEVGVLVLRARPRR